MMIKLSARLHEHPFYNVYKQRYNQTGKYHSSNGKIKPEIVSLYPDVAGKMSYPVKLVMKKTDHHSDYDNS
jgi:hypothetical protein